MLELIGHQAIVDLLLIVGTLFNSIALVLVWIKLNSMDDGHAP